MSKRSNKACFICKNADNNKQMLVNEMMFQTGDKFNYLHCSVCGCLSLIDIPDNMSKYYPKNYYSYNYIQVFSKKFKRLRFLIKKSAMKDKLGYGGKIDKIVGRFKKISFSWLTRGLVCLNSKILDVGCGNGFLIREMHDYGFTSLVGIDPFMDKSRSFDGVELLKSDIHSIKESTYDLIMYHHSFEHILNPHIELRNIYDKLRDDGTVLIRVPICDSYAFRKYQQNWVQLDAPRHYFLHTIKSMRAIASCHGFVVNDIVYDSTSFQFTGSKCYQKGVPLDAYQEIFTDEEIKKLDKKAQKLNRLQDGDSACFYLTKKKYEV